MEVTITLTAKLESLIRAKVESGYYESASEVVREALRLMDEKDRVRTAKIDLTREELRLSAEAEAESKRRARAARSGE